MTEVGGTEDGVLDARLDEEERLVHERVLDALLDEEERLVADFMAGLGKLRRRFRGEQAKIRQRRRLLAKFDPPVLVRMDHSKWWEDQLRVASSVYHTAQDACGWMGSGDPEGWEPIPRSEAERLGLRLCRSSACREGLSVLLDEFVKSASRKAAGEASGNG